MAVTMLPVEKRPVLTAKEAGAVLGVSEDTIMRMFHAGRFPGAVRMGMGPKAPLRIPKRDIPGWESYDWGTTAEEGLRELGRSA